MSQIIDELKELSQRLCSDGYPTVTIDKAINRMAAMELLIIDLMQGDTNDEESKQQEQGS